MASHREVWYLVAALAGVAAPFGLIAYKLNSGSPLGEAIAGIGDRPGRVLGSVATAVILVQVMARKHRFNINELRFQYNMVFVCCLSFLFSVLALVGISGAWSAGSILLLVILSASVVFTLILVRSVSSGPRRSLDEQVPHDE